MSEDIWVCEKIIARKYNISPRTLQKARQKKPYAGFPFARFNRSVRYNLKACAEYAQEMGLV